MSDSSEHSGWGFYCSHAQVRNPGLAGMTGRGAWAKKKNPEPNAALPSLFSLFLFPCNVLQCSSSLDLVKRSSGVAWQEPSAALSLQSPSSAVRLPLEKPSRLSTLSAWQHFSPQHCLTIAIFYHTACFIDLLCRLHFSFLFFFFLLASSLSIH